MLPRGKEDDIAASIKEQIQDAQRLHQANMERFEDQQGLPSVSKAPLRRALSLRSSMV